MCGIAGMLLPEGGRVEETTLTSMGQSQRHRGPDHFSFFCRENLGLAHNRLSILDLSAAGNQPYQSERYALVYNGEIYNYKELKMKLEKEGAIFRSTSDTAVLFEHLVRHGVGETLKAIRGMFAFSFCDLRDKTVYLCRDRYGIKPLVWKYDGGNLYWASEIKAIRAATSVSIDPAKTLFSTLGLGDPMGESTVFQNVRNVPPGSYLVCRPGKPPETVRYYDLAGEVDPGYYRELNGMPEEKIVSVFQQRLEQSVERMLASDVPVGTFVSGGVDSSLIAAIACQYNPSLLLFTSDVLGKFSEREDAELVSRKIGAELCVSSFRPQDMLAQWAEATYHYECPVIRHPNSIPFSSVAKLARQRGVKPVLTGEGSDELFLGYPSLHIEPFLRVARLPYQFLDRFYGLVPGLKKYLLSENENKMFQVLRLLFQDSESARHPDKNFKAYDFLPAGERLHHGLTLSMMNESLISILHRNDRMGMLASIESRFPFLDEDLVRFGVNLPLKWKRGYSFRFHNWKHPFTVDKRIVRLAAGKLLPQRIAEKQKSGFMMYGLPYLRVKNGFFHDGYVASIAGLPKEGEDGLWRTQSPYEIAKLAAVEIFGRLFAMGESMETVTRRIFDKTSMEISL